MLRVLSNINLEPLKVDFRNESISFAGYNQIERELLDQNSTVFSKDVTEVLVFLDGVGLLRDRFYEIPNANLISEIANEIGQLLSYVENLIRLRKTVLVMINNVVIPSRTHLTFLNANATPSFYEIEDRINAQITAMAHSYSNVWVIDWRGIVSEHGYRTLTDEKFWYLARTSLNREGFIALAREYKRLRKAILVGPKKVLLLDLDNTLWGGVLGEDGTGGIQLGEDGIGKAYREFQQALKGLKSVGILLAVVSKNAESDVLEVLQRHPMMVLRREDFTAMRINWLSKPENIVSIANELNLDTNSMVFLDDNPVERDLVRSALPMVTVPEFPEEAVELKSWLLGEVATELFGKVRLTNEDRGKTEQYQANAARTELASQLTVEEYLPTLKIRVIVDANAAQSRARVTQLFQKTTQFNFTDRHYTEDQIESMSNDPNRIIFSLQYEDKFGKEGLVAAAVIVCNGTSALIDNFVMSCRVIGRTVEMIFLRSIMRYLQARGLVTIYGEFIPTVRNTVASEVYRNVGLKQESETRYSGGIDSLLLSLGAKVIASEVCESWTKEDR